MPSKDEHLQKAKHNEKLSLTLDQEFADWTVTLIYYAGLHYIEMQLAVEGIHPKNHEERDPAIYKHHLLGRNVWKHYEKLKILSRNARYNSYPVTRNDINNARTWLKNVKTYLKSIGQKID